MKQLACSTHASVYLADVGPRRADGELAGAGGFPARRLEVSAVLGGATAAPNDD